MTGYFADKQIFYINSKDRVIGSDSDFMIELPIDQNIRYSHVTLLSASIPKSYYAVQTGFNTFRLYEASMKTVTIPPGNYTRNSFAVTLQAQLNAVGDYTYTITYDKITRSVDNGHYRFNVTNNVGIQPVLYIDNMGGLLGFDDAGEYTFVADYLESTRVVNLNPQASLIVHSNIVNQPVNSHLKAIMSSSQNSFDYILWENSNPHETSKPMTQQKSNVYKFTITDQDIRPIDFNGNHVILSVMIFRHEEPLYDMIRDYIGIRLQQEEEKVELETKDK